MRQRGTEEWREQEWGAACSTAKIIVDFCGTRLTVDRRAVRAFWAMEKVIVRHKYVVHADQTGAFNCRHIGSDPKKPWSSHAWATAVDINWRQNPDGNRLVTNMPEAMVKEIHDLKCADGTPVWRWGGDWDRDPKTGHSYYDAMHFELWATPAELDGGIVDPNAPTKVTAPKEDDMPAVKLIRIDGGKTVYVCNGAELQNIVSADIADAMWPGWRTLVQDVSSKSSLGSLPKRRGGQ